MLLNDLVWVNHAYWQSAKIPLQNGHTVHVQRAYVDGARSETGLVELGDCVAAVITATPPEKAICQFPPRWEYPADPLTMQCWLIEYLRQHPAKPYPPREVTNDTDHDDPR